MLKEGILANQRYHRRILSLYHRRHISDLMEIWLSLRLRVELEAKAVPQISLCIACSGFDTSFLPGNQQRFVFTRIAHIPSIPYAGLHPLKMHPHPEIPRYATGT